MKTFNILDTEIPVIFTVGNETFEAVPADKISAKIIATYFRLVNDGDLFKAHDQFFKTVLTADSYRRFNIRLNSKEKPITISILADITSWLIGDVFFGGESFGRSQAIIRFAIDSWAEFDSWCLIHDIKDPWKLPSYRFGALIVAYLKEDKVQEGIEIIDRSLKDSDFIPHPFFSPSFHQTIKVVSGVLSTPVKRSTSIDNIIYDSRLTDMPIEEQKRREARSKGKPYRVPEWWQGEAANYKVASSMMKVLPKKMGTPVKE